MKILIERLENGDIRVDNAGLAFDQAFGLLTFAMEQVRFQFTNAMIAQSINQQQAAMEAHSGKIEIIRPS